MNAATHSQLASFIWSICNLLRGPYKRNEYRKVILPLTVLRRFDCLLEPTKAKVLAEYPKIKGKPENVVRSLLERITKRPFYNVSKLDFQKLLDDPNQLAINLNSYINKGFSKNVREIMDRFKFEEQVARMAEKNLLYEVVKAFARLDLSSEHVDNVQMGYVFEELIRIGAEQSNEEAGEHFTPREVIKLMVNLLLSPEKDLSRSHVVKTIYDPACGTGGMLSVAEQYIRQLNSEASPHLFGQDWNDESWAVCQSDMLIKGEDAQIALGDTFTGDAFARDEKGNKRTFDYMLANPPFGVEWKQQAKKIQSEHTSLGYDGRFGAGLPRINDGSLLFLQHMISKMQAPKDGGSRIAIVFNGSPLFTGDAGSGESNIRQWIIENDWLEAIVALPDQLFYNTGISTYIWVLTNKKEKPRKGKIQLIDARQMYVKMRKSLGNKRNKIGDKDDGEPDQIGDITRIYGSFKDGETRKLMVDGKEKTLVVSKVFDNEDFGYRKITVERPLRLNFLASAERIARIDDEAIRDLMTAFAKATNEKLFRDRPSFLAALKAFDDKRGGRLSAAQQKTILSAFAERDETAEVCVDVKGNPEPDPDLRDTESIPLKESVDTYFKREVLPYAPDAWVDESKTKIGYEIPLNRHFYVYEPPRPLEEIEKEIQALETEIVAMLKEIAA